MFVQRNIHIGIVDLKHSYIATFIHTPANVFDVLHRTTELNTNMRIECIAQLRQIWYHPTVANVNVCVVTK